MFAEVSGLPVVRDPEEWLDRAPGLTSFRTQGPLARSEARRRYADGESVYITGLDQSEPRLRELCDALAADLALPGPSVTVEAWAAGGPTRVEMHFDLDFNFNLQVSGRKTWWTAPNEAIAHPTASHHVGHEKVIERTEVPSPTGMPEDARTWIVEPGDVVYLPQGVWHATATDEATFALAFVIKPATWAQHVSKILLERLHADVRWRERMLGGREPSNRQALGRRAAEALAAAESVLEQVSPADLLHLGEWGGAPELLERHRDVHDVRLEIGETGGQLAWTREGRDARIAVPKWARGVVQFIVDSRHAWSVATVQELAEPSDAHWVTAIVLQLLSAGFVRKVP